MHVNKKRVPRCHVDLSLEVSTEVTLPAKVSRHLRQVLRMRTDEEVILFNGQDGRDYRARLIGLNKQAVKTHIISAGPKEPEPILKIHLAIGISKATRMDYALQKSVELGVTSITPLVAQHTVVRLSDERMTRRMNHWRGIIVHACEQSGRRWLPILHPASSLNDWLEKNPFPGLLLDHAADKSLLDISQPETPVCILVGPEGGLDDREKQLAQARGIVGIRLGPRVLRTETAPLAAIAAMQILWGDFR